MSMATGDAVGRSIVFFGSGAFGVPTLERLAESGAVALVDGEWRRDSQ